MSLRGAPRDSSRCRPGPETAAAALCTLCAIRRRRRAARSGRLATPPGRAPRVCANGRALACHRGHRPRRIDDRLRTLRRCGRAHMIPAKGAGRSLGEQGVVWGRGGRRRGDGGACLAGIATKPCRCGKAQVMLTYYHRQGSDTYVHPQTTLTIAYVQQPAQSAICLFPVHQTKLCRLKQPALSIPMKAVQPLGGFSQDPVQVVQKS